MNSDNLIIYPTQAALRRAQTRGLADGAARDVSRQTTFRQLLSLCERAARIQGLLHGRTPPEAEQRTRQLEAAGRISLDRRNPLSRLPQSGLASTLGLLVDRFAVFAGKETACIEWLRAHTPDHPLHGAGCLLESWLDLCREEGLADRFAINRALLRLIETGDLPPLLDGGLHFVAVRWLNPFEERFVAALKQRLGPDRVRVESALPPAHAEAAEDRLCIRVRSEMQSCAEEEWHPWIEEFADAIETDDANLLPLDSGERVSFFIAAHPYGEVEDAARRISREIEQGCAPERIALVVRNLGPYSDIIPDVFKRFGIPCHFRRGSPASAHAPVKTLLALLHAQASPERDRLCDLLLLPDLHWPGLDEARRMALLRELRFGEPPVLPQFPRALRNAFGPPPAAHCTLREFAAWANETIRRHGLTLPDEVVALLGELAAAGGPPLESRVTLRLFEELLGNCSLRNPDDTESGVWILNALDIAGLHFDSIHLIGMDDRTFPQIPQGDPLFDNTERQALRAFLDERRIPCPRLALPDPGAQLIQEEILFLTVLGAAGERLSLSCAQFDATGKEQVPGQFFERIRSLIGGDAPKRGASFHPILPPGECRAEDEIRQTHAWLTARSRDEEEERTANDASGREPIARLIDQWMHPDREFSATALESLARNRLVFFIERMLGAHPLRTREDEPDPMDRGSVIHEVLEAVYTALAAHSGWFAVPSPDSDGGPSWHLSQEATDDALPLVAFRTACADEIRARAEQVARETLERISRDRDRRLGHPSVWACEQQKILQITRTLVEVDLDTAERERRYPALFEMPFGRTHDRPLAIQRDGITIFLKGKVDRIDLLFAEDGTLDHLLVVDYKSTSRNDRIDELEQKIRLNLDCQLPLYLLAAQQYFFGESATAHTLTHSSAVYHLQGRKPDAVCRHFQKQRLTMSTDLFDAFSECLFTHLEALRNGDLAAEPLIEGYDDWSHICRCKPLPIETLLHARSL